MLPDLLHEALLLVAEDRVEVVLPELVEADLDQAQTRRGELAPALEGDDERLYEIPFTID
jgi:hypothetical protein